ncbi:MAG: methyltransferase protein [Burkholderiaceae bacterium]|nr:methyltransferase protein [Burkholderiaceae bacterium]
MPDSHDTEYFDSLIRRIREEAKEIERQNPAIAATTKVTPGRTVSARPESPVALLSADAPHIDDFFMLDDSQFFEHAYRAILRREPDEPGIENYTRLLEQGHTRLHVLMWLRRSEEGRRHRATIGGMCVASLLFIIDRVANRLRFGRFGRAPLRLYERHLFRRNRYFMNINQMLTAQQENILHLEDNLGNWRPAVAGFKDQLQDVNKSLHMVREDALYFRQSLQLASSQQPPAASRSPETTTATTSNIALDAYYVAFEDANRGSRDEILAKLAVYDELFDSLQQTIQGPLLDIGCGRGELLGALKQRGIPAEGVDANPVMVEQCRQAGHVAHHGDALAHLSSLPSDSLAAITGFHIVEHLPFDTLFGIFQQCYRALKPGGFILFETPNPENVLVGSHTFYHDFTHRNPVTPTSLQFLARYQNFDHIRVIRSNPYPAEAKVPGNDPLTARVNGHFCGPQDYALLAYKPVRKDAA